MSTIIAESLKSTFDTDGYVIARNVLDADLMAEASDHVDWLIDQNPHLRPENLGHTLVPDDPFWLRLVSDDRLLDIAEQFIGPNIALFASHYICKPPHTGKRVAWHQDGSYWPLEPMEVVTLWLAVNDSTPENGCMRVLPETQNSRLIRRNEMVDDTDSVLGTGIARDQIDENQAVDLILKAGDVSIHHPAVIHGSNANESAMWRKGLTIRYIPATTKITNPDHQPPFLMRGDHSRRANEYLPMPTYEEGRHMAFRDSDQWR